jgi:hypothetical protein
VKLADRDSDQAESGEADRRGHAADLAVFPFDQTQFYPACGDRKPESDWWIALGIARVFHKSRLARRGLHPLNENALSQFLKRRFGRGAFDLDVIGPFMSVIRLEEALGPSFFVAQEKEPLTVGIEPADGVNIFGESKFRERPVMRRFFREL